MVQLGWPLGAGVRSGLLKKFLAPKVLSLEVKLKNIRTSVTVAYVSE